jgi:hypothetical protein
MQVEIPRYARNDSIFNLYDALSMRFSRQKCARSLMDSAWWLINFA